MAVKRVIEEYSVEQDLYGAARIKNVVVKKSLLRHLF
jgi:hypothetical protein